MLAQVVRKEGFVFLKGRAELVIEVESTMNQDDGQLQVGRNGAYDTGQLCGL
jgi:hypothetical protein